MSRVSLSSLHKENVTTGKVTGPSFCNFLCKSDLTCSHSGTFHPPPSRNQGLVSAMVQTKLEAVFLLTSVSCCFKSSSIWFVISTLIVYDPILSICYLSQCAPPFSQWTEHPVHISPLSRSWWNFHLLVPAQLG